MLTNLSLYN